MYGPRSKKIATIIIGGMSGSDESRPEEAHEPSEDDLRKEALKAASKGILKAIKDDNPEMLAMALKSAVSCCME